MTKIQQIESVNEVIAKWQRLLTLERPTSPDLLLTMFLRCLDDGAVFFVYGDRGLMGTCCLVNHGDFIDLLSLPRDYGVGMARECLAHVYDYAREIGVDEVRVTTTNLCGSSFKYFERSLGFRRQAVIFTKSI